MEFQKVEDLFKKIYTESGDNLDRMIKNNSIALPTNVDDDFSEALKNFLDAVVEVCLINEDVNILEALPAKENCNEFIKWVAAYVDERVQPLKETAFLKELSLEDFNRLAHFCFQNYVIVDSGKKILDGADDTWTMEKIDTMKKVILTIAEMQVLRLYPSDRILKITNEIFRISNDCGNILIKIIHENEERLWKYLMFRRLEHLEFMMEDFESD